MKPKNLEDFRKLSNIVENGSDLLVQSSKMNFEKNEYKNEIWKYSKNIWKKYKWSEKKNFSSPKYSHNKKMFSYIKSEKINKKDSLSTLCVQSGSSIKNIFETKDSIQSYIWSSNDKYLYVVTKEWDSYFKKLDNKEMEPLYLENLPFRFDTRGIIYNRRNHLYKVNISSSSSSKIINGDKENFISIGSIVEKESSLYFTASSYNETGTMLDEKILKKTGNSLETIRTEGSWGKLFVFNNDLYGIGLEKRFDWPTNISIFKISDSGRTRILYPDLDRTVTNVKCSDSSM